MSPQTGIPPAAIAEMAAALEDYHRTIPAYRQTTRGAAEFTAHYLTANGWDIQVPREAQPRPRARAACPACTAQPLITQQGRIRRHGPHGHPCPGSGMPAQNASALATQPNRGAGIRHPTEHTNARQNAA